ncbi:MAG: site-specific integrase [Clostridiales bacterium]|nr:site-specific integrase [Clostridiales bacterium]
MALYFEPSKLTVSQWLDTWLSEYVQPSCKPLSLSTYKSRVETHIKPALGKIKLSELNSTQIQTLYNDLTRRDGLAPKTIKNVHGILHKCLTQAVKLRGMREGEVCGLSWDAVNFKNGTITVKQQLQKGKEKGSRHYIAATKNDKVRIITSAPFVIEVLKQVYNRQIQERYNAGTAWSNEWNLVFTNSVGEFIVPQTALKHFKSICARIGCPNARFHDLQHTYAVISLQEGDDVKTVQQNLGHATASFTLDVYGHVSEKMKQDSAARMERLIEKVKA